MGITKIASNLTKVTDSKGVEIWYSYETPVAVRFDGTTLVSINEWSNTTARHLTRIDGGTPEAKSARVSHDKIVALLADLGH